MYSQTSALFSWAHETMIRLYINGCRIYIHVYYNRGKIVVAKIDIIYWSVRSSSRRGWGKGGGSGDRYFSQLQGLLY